MLDKTRLSVALLLLAWPAAAAGFERQLSLGAGGGAPAGAEDQIPAHIAEMEVIGGMFDSFTLSSWDPETDRLEFFYGDRKNTIHHMVFQNGEFTRLWRSPPLGGTIQTIEIADLDANGERELITYTAKNEAQIWDYEERYKIRWESRREANFTTIQSLAVADIDSDRAMELIF